MASQPKFIPKPGQIDFTDAKIAPVLNCIVKYGEKILLVRRSRNMNIYPGAWSGVTGFLDEPTKTVAEKIREELEEEIGIGEKDITSIKEGAVLEQKDEKYDKTWLVHTALAELATTNVKLNWESEEYRWVTPGEILAFDIVPGFKQVLQTFFTI